MIVIAESGYWICERYRAHDIHHGNLWVTKPQKRREMRMTVFPTSRDTFMLEYKAPINIPRLWN